MSGSKNRWLIAGISSGALVLVVVAAAMVLQPSRAPRDGPPATERAALQVQQGQTDAQDGTKAGGGAALRCFVDGRFVGVMTIAACAQKNGVSSQGLDVGLAPVPAAEGAQPVAAAAPPVSDGEQADTDRQAAAASRDEAVSSSEDGQTCLRYVAGGWRPVGAGRMPVGACVHALYQGRCVSPGDALYGRSGDLTLRLVPGRVESSDDNRRFRPLLDQNDDCTLAD